MKFNLKNKSKVVKSKKTTKAKMTEKQIKKLIDKRINKNIEDKEAYHVINTGETTLTDFNSQINSTADMQQLIPNISVGASENQRIGNQITAKSLYVSGYFKFKPSVIPNATNYPNVCVRLMILSLKTAPNYTEANETSTPLNSLLRKGGTTSAYLGKLSDIFAPINTDLFTVHHNSVSYLTQSIYLQPSGATVASVSADLKNTVKFFDIKLKLKNKILKYDDTTSSGLLPTNYGPFMLLGYTYLDGSSPDLLNTACGMFYTTSLKYQDA